MKTASNRGKGAIRREILAKRDSLSHEEKASKDAAIHKNLLSLAEYEKANKVLFFASFKSETETLSLISRALKAGKRVLLPRVEADKLAIYEIHSPGELQKGYMGIPEPPPDAKKSGINSADLVIMPGAAFDLSGGRLGYGKGYYDKMLEGLKKPVPLVALAYELQVIEGGLPLDEHDVRVHKIVTEKRVIDCRGQGKD